MCDGGTSSDFGMNKKACPRCSLEYSIELVECPECKGLSDAEARKHGQKHRDEVAHLTKGLSKKLFVLAIISLLMLVVGAYYY